MTCPYPHCGGQIQPRTQHAGYCDKCSRPALFCENCGAANRSFARYCRKCLEPLNSFAAQQSVDGELQIKALEQPRRIEIDRTFWLGPMSYKCLIWCLSVTGELWSISPVASLAHSCGALEEGFGKSAFTISEADSDDKTDKLPTYLLSANRHSIRGINLLNGIANDFFQAPAGELLLSSSADSYVGLESIGRMVYFLKKRETQTHLSSYHLFNHTGEDVLLPEPRVVGPFKIGNQIGVYSKSQLYLLKDGAMVSSLSFPNFQAWTAPDEFSRIQQRVGYMPFLLRQNAIYIPGQRGAEQGFLYVSFHEQGANVSFCRMTGDVAYTQDMQGRLLVAGNGKIEIYEGSNPVTVRADPELNAQLPPFYHELLTVGFIRTAGGVEALRFYSGADSRDYSLSQLSGLIGIGFLYLAGNLIFSYLRERNDRYSLGLLIWDVN